MMRIAPLALGIAALTLAAPAFAALPVGAKAPDIVTKAARGGKMFDFALKTALKKGPVVVYFFPAAFTSGCTVEAHEFAEAAAEFEKQGATLIGLTAGNVDRIAEFSKVECRDKFPVGAATAKVISGYDVALAAKPGWTDRTSYVIAPNGKIIYTLSQMSPAGHVQGTLAAVKAYKATKKAGLIGAAPSSPLARYPAMTSIEALRLEMEAAAEAQDFARAAELRDRISILRGQAQDEAGAAAGIDTAGLTRQQPGSMGIGTSQQRYTPPPGWTPPKKPDPMTKGRGRRKSG